MFKKVLILTLALPFSGHTFSLNAPSTFSSNTAPPNQLTTRKFNSKTTKIMMMDKSRDIDSNAEFSRRNALSSFTKNLLLLGGVSSMALTKTQPALAEEAAKDTIFLTGKSPKVPGQKPKDKSDVSGTRKDPKFLRSVSDCKVCL